MSKHGLSKVQRLTQIPKDDAKMNVCKHGQGPDSTASASTLRSTIETSGLAMFDQSAICEILARAFNRTEYSKSDPSFQSLLAKAAGLFNERAILDIPDVAPGQLSTYLNTAVGSVKMAEGISISGAALAKHFSDNFTPDADGKLNSQAIEEGLVGQSNVFLKPLSFKYPMRHLNAALAKYS